MSGRKGVGGWYVGEEKGGGLKEKEWNKGFIKILYCTVGR